MLSRLALSALVLCLLPGIANAQRSSFTPTLGVYIPTTELVKAAAGQKFKQEISISIGARMALWMSQRIGLEVAGDYSPSKLHFSAPGTGNTESADIISASGRLTVVLVPATSVLSLRLIGGASGVRRSGAAYSTEETDIGGVVGAVAGFRLGGLSLQFTVEDYIYSATFSGTTQTSSKTQHDIHMGFGFGGM